MDHVLLIGIAGATITLFFYILQQFGRITETHFWYDAGNVLGGALLTTYAILIGSLPFAVLNSIWTLVAFYDTVQHLLNKRS